MAEKAHINVKLNVNANDVVDIPKDIAGRLDHYAVELGKEYLFPVSRQQAWERLARTFLPIEGTANGL